MCLASPQKSDQTHGEPTPQPRSVSANRLRSGLCVAGAGLEPGLAVWADNIGGEAKQMQDDARFHDSLAKDGHAGRGLAATGQESVTNLQMAERLA